MTNLLIFIGLLAWAHIIDNFAHRKVSCSCPLPGPSFPWHRCLPGCSWCDYIADWDRVPEPDHQGPYR